HTGEPLAFATRVGKLLSLLLIEERLVVKCLELRRTAALKEINDPFGLRRMVRRSQHTRRRTGVNQIASCQQVGERNPPEAHAEPIQELTACKPESRQPT